MFPNLCFPARNQRKERQISTKVAVRSGCGRAFKSALTRLCYRNRAKKGPGRDFFLKNPPRSQYDVKNGRFHAIFANRRDQPKEYNWGLVFLRKVLPQGGTFLFFGG
jgi:hypothetical protein